MSLVLVLALLFAGMPPEVAAAPAIERELVALTEARSLWPGFEPRRIPLAIFDGEQTWLFRHPQPPDGFEARNTGSVMAGRHPAVTANSSALIGETATATLILPTAAEPIDARRWAATALHEAFHVFQRARHPGWSGNEASAFLYPFGDSEQLIQRRLETASLARAVAATAPDESACWAGVALAYRERRYRDLADEFVAYERATELNEGLATYIADRALESTGQPLPAEGWDAQALRLRAYATGSAMAHLLDRLAPGWQDSLETEDSQPLDRLLGDAVADAQGGCALPGAEVAEIKERARADAAAVLEQRRSTRSAFAALPGHRLRIETAPDRPLWPQGFDPLNVRVLDGGHDLLHSRMLTLANEQARIELLNTGESTVQAVTAPAGEHPLFNGIRHVELAGLASIESRTEDGRTLITAPGLEIRVPAGTLSRAPETWVINLP